MPSTRAGDDGSVSRTHAAQPLSDSLWLETVDTLPTASLGTDVMACVVLSPDGAPQVGEDPRYIPLNLPLLSPASGFELWKSQRTVTWDRDAGIGFAHDGEVLFGSLSVLEGGPQAVAADTFKCYARRPAPGGGRRKTACSARGRHHRD